MQIIENLKVKEKLYTEKLDNGLTVMIIPKHNTMKKYIIWSTHFGSIDNHFINPKNGKEEVIPDGVAHFLEHKMFEQRNGTNSLDTLSALGVDANAYTTNDHTAYLYEATDNFYEALDEFMDYVQNPYFTDENVEKEKGIIAQEIKMYDDYPDWQVYLNAIKCLYKENPVRLDIAGTVESISEITPEILYSCCDTFYNPANMVMVVCGDFEPEELLKEIKKRIIKNENYGEIKRIYPAVETQIFEKEKVVKMDVNNPLFTVGFLDKVGQENIVKHHISIEILLEMLFGKSSELYRKLYSEGLLLSEPQLDYEFTNNYAHVLITGQSQEPRKVIEELKQKINQIKEQGIDEKLFDRTKKKIYGRYITDYNSVEDIAKMFLSDYFKGINSFEYLEEYNQVTIDSVKKVLDEVLIEDNMVISIVESK